MLSASPLKNVTKATEYFFEKDNYYLQDSNEAKENSEWAGIGAETLGLSGQVEEKQFEALLKGQLPTGEQLGKPDGDKKRRLGFDLTFSAPKSFSVLAELGQDTRLHDAHKNAVKETLTYIEEHFAQARMTQNYETRYENTGNLVIAQVKHDTSRALDPQTHTHCIVMNATQRQDGHWRALASSTPGQKSLEVNGFFERVLKNERALGAIYRSSLAYEVSQLGYTVEKTHNDGRFRITEVPKEVDQQFSKRREEIDQFLDENGLSGARASAFATKETRTKKQAISRDTLRASWQAQAQELGFDAKDIVGQAKQRTELPEKEEIREPVSHIATEAVQYAIRHLSERDTVLSHAQLVNTALTHALTEVKLSDVLGAMHQAMESKDLIPLTEDRYTTKTLLQYEQDIMNSVTSQRYHVMPIIPKTIQGKGIEITAEQTAAIKQLLNTHDRFSALLGSSGTGKTALIPTLADTVKREGFKTWVLTPRQAAANDLASSGLKTQSLSSFLKDMEKQMNLDKPLHLNKHVFILDSAEIASTNQKRDFMGIIEKLGSRAIFLGDTRGYLPREGGNPLEQLRKAGIHTAELTTLHRQTQQHNREAILATLAGNLESAFEKIGDRIRIVENTEDRMQYIAKHYATLSKNERTQTLVLVPTQKERHDMNTLIREELKQAGTLEKSSLAMTAFVPKRLTHAQTTSARYYTEDDKVRFHGESRSQSIEAKVYYHVLSRDIAHNRVELLSPDGEVLKINPAELGKRIGSVALFEPKTLEVCVGEQLRASQRTSKQGLANGEKATVTHIKKHMLHVERENGKTLKLDTRNIADCHIDYGYAVTPYSTQHEHPKTIIAHQSSQTPMTHLRSFYKQLSQARDTAWLYTDARERYLDVVKERTGDRVTALQAVADKIPIENSHILQQESLETMSKNAVQFAIAELSEREATFSLTAIFNAAITMKVFGQVPSKQIHAFINEAITEKQLIPGRDKEQWTTPEAVAIEKEILTLAKACQGEREPIASHDVIQGIFANHRLNEEQKQSAQMISQTRDAVVLVQGFSGTGKTTMLTCTQAICTAQGYTLRGLAPTHTAVQQMQDRGISAQTLHSFLADFQNYKEGHVVPDYSKTVWVLDESSMVSNRLFRDLLAVMKESHALMVPIGDKAQLSSSEAGKPFWLLQEAGIRMQIMRDIQRQKDSPVLLAAVKDTISKDFKGAFEKLNQQCPLNSQPTGIIELKEVEDQKQHYLDPLVKDYISRSREQRAQTLVITPANADRIIVNDLIRTQLKREGTLIGEESKISILLPRNLSKVATGHSDQYKIGDVVHFNCGIRSVGITKGSYLSVSDIDTNTKTLLLKNDKNETIAWQPHKQGGQRKGGVEVYTRENRGLCVGDQIRWTRSQKAQGQFSADTANVIAIKEQTATIKLHNGNIQNIDMTKDQNKHFDHAYASTTYAAQGKTIRHVITYEDSRHTNLTNQAGFYVAISRAKLDATIYTNDSTALQDRLIKNTGEKTSAMELTGASLKNMTKVVPPIQRVEQQFGLER
jgi:conjugative transfer relaxase protein TraI